MTEPDLSEKQARLDALDRVLHLFRGTDPPGPADLIALAQWVESGSAAAAMALEDQKAALYSDRRRGEDL